MWWILSFSINNSCFSHNIFQHVNKKVLQLARLLNTFIVSSNCLISSKCERKRETTDTCHQSILFFTATHSITKGSAHKTMFRPTARNSNGNSARHHIFPNVFPLSWERVGVWGNPLSVRLSLFPDTFHFAEICILIGSTLGQYHRYWKIHILAEISIISISLKVAGDKANLSLFKDNTSKENRESLIFQF